MTEERFAAYIDSLEPDAPALFREIEEKAAAGKVPILRPMSAAFLETLMLVKKPRRILEIGTAVGYSGLKMLLKVPEAILTTIDCDPERLKEAEANFVRGGCADRVSILCGDAAEVLPGLTGSFDFIFLDGPKAQYEAYLPLLKKLLARNGVLLADNVLQEGRILEARTAVIRRDRTIHERLRRFIREMYRDSDFRTSLIPLEDGLLLAARTGRKEELS